MGPHRFREMQRGRQIALKGRCSGGDRASPGSCQRRVSAVVAEEAIYALANAQGLQLLCLAHLIVRSVYPCVPDVHWAVLYTCM